LIINDPTKLVMNIGLVIPQKVYTKESRRTAVADKSAAAAMTTKTLTECLTACCFKEDCPTKSFEHAVLAEVIHRLQHPLSWRLRRVSLKKFRATSLMAGRSII